MAQLIAELRGLLVRMGYVVPESSQRRSRPVTGKHATLPEGQPAFLDRCPMPLFILSKEGRVLVANPVCCQVLETPLEELLHRPLAESHLGRLYPTLGEDLAEAARLGHAILRHIQFRADAGAGAASMHLWLTPERDPDGDVQQFWGVLMPLPMR
jgi:PAS domain-containing protein